MKVNIRKLDSSDIRQTLLIYSEVVNRYYISYGEIAYGLSNLKKFFGKAEDYFGKYIAGSLHRDDLAVYVAVSGKDIVGFICVEIKKVEAGHKECWLIDLGVTESFRRRGVAKKLIQKAYFFGNNNKVKYFFLESGYSNIGAHSLFKKEGFIPLNIVFVKKAGR
jgi:ribosomal protein S18 acetylase RimI-like enzyme